MGVVFGERSREVLASMLTLREQEQKNEKKVSFIHLSGIVISCHRLKKEQPSPYCKLSLLSVLILFICVGWSYVYALGRDFAMVTHCHGFKATLYIAYISIL